MVSTPHLASDIGSLLQQVLTDLAELANISSFESILSTRHKSSTSSSPYPILTHSQDQCGLSFSIELATLQYRLIK